MRVLDGKCLAINMLRSNQLILREYVKKSPLGTLSWFPKFGGFRKKLYLCSVFRG